MRYFRFGSNAFSFILSLQIIRHMPILQISNTFSNTFKQITTAQTKTARYFNIFLRNCPV